MLITTKSFGLWWIVLSFAFIQHVLILYYLQWEKTHSKFFSEKKDWSYMHCHVYLVGMFRKVATCSMQISSQESPDCLYNIKQLNQYFLSFSMTSPTLTLQWCNILILLNFDDQILWSDVMQTPKRYLKPGMRLVYIRNNVRYLLWSYTKVFSKTVYVQKGGWLFFVHFFI